MEPRNPRRRPCICGALVLALLSVHCSSSPPPPVHDGGPVLDGGPAVDGGGALDGGTVADGGVAIDGGVADGGIAVDGGAVDGGAPVATIQQLQNGQIDAGTCVRVEGVAMSSVFTDGDDTRQGTARKAFYLSEKGLGTTAPRTGIEVTVDPNVPAPATIAIGDDLTIVGGFLENFGNSTIRLRTDCGTITKNGSGAVPQPAVVTINQIGQTCPAASCDPGGTTWVDGTSAEDYEGVLVKIEGGTVSATNYFGQFEVSDGTANLLVSTHFGIAVAPSVGDPVTAITGFGHFSYRRRKIRPRTDAEVAITTDARCPSFARGQVSGTVSSPAINEASGLVASRRNPGVLWVHNDSGDSPRIFAMSQSGAQLGIYNLSGAGAVDWEDMAADNTHLYLGDIGDNAEARSFITVYRVAEPEVSSTQDPVEVDLPGAERLELQYPDRAHNAEALLVDPTSGDIFVVTKEGSGESFVFRDAAPHTPSTRTTLQQVGTLPFGSPSLPGSKRVTAGDTTPDRSAVLIRTYDGAFWWPWATGTSLWEALSGDPCPVVLESEPQGETIAFTADGTGFFTLSEGSSQPLYYFAPRQGQ